MFSMVLVGSGSISFDTDPDPDSGSSHFLIRIRIQIQGNDTDSTDPDPQHCYRQQLLFYFKTFYFCFDQYFSFLNDFVSFRYRNNSISKLYYLRTCIIVDIPTGNPVFKLCIHCKADPHINYTGIYNKKIRRLFINTR